MLHFPKFRKLSTAQTLDFYAKTYEKCSGLPVPMAYLESNHVFGIYLGNKMVGGFILGSGEQLRTIEFFAAPEVQEKLYTQMEAPNSYTEICCFWIAPAYRRKTAINYFTWISMAFALKKYAQSTSSSAPARGGWQLYTALRPGLFFCIRILSRISRLSSS